MSRQRSDLPYQPQPMSPTRGFFSWAFTKYPPTDEATSPAAPALKKSRRCMIHLRCRDADLRQHPNPQIFELDRRAFGFQAQVTAGRLRVLAARNLLAVDPQPHLAVDPAHV